MCININETNWINIILISIYITYYVLPWLTIPNFLSVSLAIKLTAITKHRQFLMRGLWSSLCKCHSSRTSYNLNTELVLYQRIIIQLRTILIPTLNQYHSRQSTWPSKFPFVQRSQPVWKIMTLLCCSVFLFCRKLNHENQITSYRTNQWYKSNHHNTICNI